VLLSVLLVAVAFPRRLNDHWDDQDDGDEDFDTKDCQFENKPWREMPQSDKILKGFSASYYMTSENDAQIGFLFSGKKGVDVGELKYRGKYIKDTWDKNTMTAEDRANHIDKDTDMYFSEEFGNLHKSSTAADFEAYLKGLELDDSDITHFDGIAMNLSELDSSWDFYAVWVGSRTQEDLDGVIRVRQEIMRQDSTGVYRVDACTKTMVD